MEEALPHRIKAVPFLARLLLDGKGLPADEARAIRALTAAVEAPYAEGRYAGEDARYMCLRILAKCYAEGRGAAKDRRKAAEFYRQAEHSDCYLFDYYKDGVDVPRDPRAAVRYWMRDRCYPRFPKLWNAILGLVSSPEGCVRFRPDLLLGFWNGLKQQSGEEAFYDLMRERTDLLAASGRTDDEHTLLCSLLDREKVRLLYDGARGGDGRCGDILKELLDSGAATREMLEQLRPNSSGVYDWPDRWYEEALGLMESELAWEARQPEPCRMHQGPAPKDRIPEPEEEIPEEE